MITSNWMGGDDGERDVAARDTRLTSLLNRWLCQIKRGELEPRALAAMLAERLGDRAPHLQPPEGIEAFCREVDEICASMPVDDTVASVVAPFRGRPYLRWRRRRPLRSWRRWRQGR